MNSWLQKSALIQPRTDRLKLPDGRVPRPQGRLPDGQASKAQGRMDSSCFLFVFFLSFHLPCGIEFSMECFESQPRSKRSNYDTDNEDQVCHERLLNQYENCGFRGRATELSSRTSRMSCRLRRNGGFRRPLADLWKFKRDRARQYQR